MMLRRRATLLLAIIVAVALLAALPSFAVGRDLASLRIGTPALATRGLQEEDFIEVGRILAEALTAEDFSARQGELAERAGAIAGRYPLYPTLSAATGNLIELFIRRLSALPRPSTGPRCPACATPLWKV